MYLTLRNYVSTLISYLAVHCHAACRTIITCDFPCACETDIPLHAITSLP